MTGTCERCGKWADLQRHHRKLRSQLGDDSEANLVEICFDCHTYLHAHPAEAYETGWMVKSWDDPGSVAYQAILADAATEAVEPGKECPKCHRRIPHPKKETSPKTRTFAYRVPVDDAETHRELLDAWASHWGILGEKHHLFKLVEFAAAEALAGPKRDFS